MKILLADDEKELLDGLTYILTKNNYSVDSCQSGEDALMLSETYRYDALILDIMMPGMDGYEVLRQLREKGDKTPVLFLTAKGDLEDKIRGFDLGADDYLSKPFESMELLARLQALIRRTSGLSDNFVKFGNTTLNLNTFRLHCKDKEESLSNKEFQILELLATKPGKVFSTQAIMEKIWPYDTAADISTVWSFLSNLRRKLREIGSDAIIESHRGLGYSLEFRNV